MVSPCTQRLGKKRETERIRRCELNQVCCSIPRPAPPHVLEFLSLTCMLRGRTYVCTTQLRPVGMEATISKKKKGCQKCLLFVCGSRENQQPDVLYADTKWKILRKRGCVWCVTTRTFFSSQSQGGYWEIPDLDEQRQGWRSMSCEQRVVFSWVQLLLPFSLTL